MSACKTCGREMRFKLSCVISPIDMKEGPPMAQVPYGKETRYPGPPPTNECHDCMVPVGGYHHPGCDYEECPKCHRQIIGCGCPGRLD